MQRREAPNAPAAAVAGLTVSRRQNAVLKNLQFTLAAGQVTGLLGPSGSGKTTLMRCLVGVQKITSGSVEVFGIPAGDKALRHRVGYVTQAPSVYADISVEDNVRYFGALHGKSRANATAAVNTVGLGPQAKQATRDLSGGQFSRVSLACALVAEPDLLILDEPTVGLDPVLRVQLWERFAALAAAGTTLLISSHVMEEAAHCDSLLLLRGGELLDSLSPAELRAKAGTDDLELAFLRLIQSHASATAEEPR